MGYEIRLHIMEIYPTDKKDVRIGTEIASIDLCKLGSGKFSTYVAEQKIVAKEVSELCAGIWDSDGDTLISKDRYDEYLPMLDPKKCLEYMEADFEESRKEYSDKSGYRRFVLAIMMLMVILERFQSDNIKVLPFGH